MNRFGIVDPPSNPVSVPSTVDRYLHMEVFARHKVLETLYGTVVRTSADDMEITIRTEGRAINSTEVVRVVNARERQCVHVVFWHR